MKQTLLKTYVGFEVVVTTIHGKQLWGYLAGLKDDAAILENEEYGTTTISCDGISEIKIQTKNKLSTFEAMRTVVVYIPDDVFYEIQEMGDSSPAYQEIIGEFTGYTHIHLCFMNPELSVEDLVM